MKHSHFAYWILIASSLPAIAAGELKLELVAPKDPVVVSAEALEEVTKAAEASLAYQEEMQSPKPDRETMMRLQKLAAGAQKAEQGIELKYRITNTGDEAVTLQHGGDATSVLLEITGPGAVDLPYKGMMTMEFRMGRPISIESGKSEEFSIKELKYGKRDMSRWLITKAGDYEVIATYITTANGQRLELKSPAVKFTVKSE